VRGCGITTARPTTRPHVTLARTDRGLPHLPWLAGVDGAGGPLRVDGFELLFNPGARYEPLGSWRLTGRATAIAG